MSDSTLRTGDLITIRLAGARVTAHHPDQERLVVQTAGGQTLHIAYPQPGLHITCLTSGAPMAPAQDRGIEPAAVLAPPAVLPSSGRGTPTLLVDPIPGWSGHVEPRPITDPALTTQDGSEHSER